eukprot:366045-Chlamydomonas_euryale.AAC.10
MQAAALPAVGPSGHRLCASPSAAMPSISQTQPIGRTARPLALPTPPTLATALAGSRRLSRRATAAAAAAPTPSLSPLPRHRLAASHTIDRGVTTAVAAAAAATSEAASSPAAAAPDEPFAGATESETSFAAPKAFAAVAESVAEPVTYRAALLARSNPDSSPHGGPRLVGRMLRVNPLETVAVVVTEAAIRLELAVAAATSTHGAASWAAALAQGLMSCAVRRAQMHACMYTHAQGTSAAEGRQQHARMHARIIACTHNCAHASKHARMSVQVQLHALHTLA